MAFPGDVNSLGSVSGSQTLAAAGHATRHNEVKTALEGIRDALGGTAVPSGTVQPILAAGSASAPSLSFTGDSNTGLWSPAADTVAASTGGTERLRIDSDGNTFGVAAQNLIYNGAMQVAQRGTSTAGITAAGYYTADRWSSALSHGTWTQSVENDAPTGSGFRKSLKMLCTTAKASLSAGDYHQLKQILEGQDVQRLAKGTASAQQVTLSFWVKSNRTGTYIAELEDLDNGRTVSGSYTVSASATWEKKTITFPADTTGAFDNDNAGSLALNWWLGAGTDYSSGALATTWVSTTSANRAVGQVNLAAATNNYWQVTGVQLEVGPIASPFQFKSYGQELAQCQRYYYKHCSGSSAIVAVGLYASATEIQTVVPFPVTMRTKPSGVIASGTDYYRFYVNGGTSDFVNSFTLATESTASAAFLYNTSEASGTSGMAGVIWANNAAASVAFNAEL